MKHDIDTVSRVQRENTFFIAVYHQPISPFAHSSIISLISYSNVSLSLALGLDVCGAFSTSEMIF